MDKIIIERKNGEVSIIPIEHGKTFETVREYKKNYQYAASAWDYSARIGNPINFYFVE